MRAEDNKIIQPISKPIAEKLHLLPYFLNLAVHAIDPINIIFSFAGLESIFNFYHAVSFAKEKKEIYQKLQIHSISTLITEKNTGIQKKLLTDHFAAELNDALVHDVVTSPAHSFHFKLKVQLENIVRLHSAIPMDLRKILRDFCMSKQCGSNYDFLISYLEKSSQTIIITEFIEQSNDTDRYIKSAGITALSDIFIYLDVEQKNLF